MKKFLLILMLLPLMAFAQADIFFSEYIEPTDYTKRALEIYNPTDATVSLDNYVMVGTANDATDWEYTYEFPAGATIAPGDVYVIIDEGCTDDALIAIADWVATGYEVGYNGNDARGLKRLDTDAVIDVVGNPVTDGSGYSCAGVSDALTDHTLVRKSTVTTGNPDWTSSAGTNAEDSEWIVYDADTFDYLGSHTVGGNIAPLISDVTYYNFDAASYIPISAAVTDDSEVASVTLHYYVISQTLGTGSEVTASMIAAAADIYSANIDATTLVDGDAVVYWVTAIDDSSAESSSSEYKVVLGTAPLAVTHARTDDGLTLLYEGFLIKVQGVLNANSDVYNTSSYEMHIQDATSGVQVRSYIDYTTEYAEGDMLEVSGELQENYGMSRVFFDDVDDITVVSTGNAVTPLEVTTDEFTQETGEVYEGMLVKLYEVDYVSEDNYGNMTMTDGNGGEFILNESSSNIDSIPAATWPSSWVMGVVKYNYSYYKVYPRYVSDIDGLENVLAVDDNPMTITGFKVEQNYPNPFNPTTQINFTVPNTGKAVFTVFNILGQQVYSETLQVTAGMNTVNFDGADLSSGVYFYNVSQGKNSMTKKMVLMK